MEIITISPTYRFMQKIGYFLSGIYSSRLNPLYYLGAITVFLLILDVISGIYLFFFYDVDPTKAYQSVEEISSSFLGNLMRGIHRYSSDGLILFAVLHMLHMILTDRFRMFRWIAWVSGVGTLLLFWVIGLSGYLLVWDERAQLTGIITAKFFSVIPIFGHTLMSAFLGTDPKYLSGLFRILLFGHIAVTILLVFTLWVHVMRISRPRLFPPKPLMILLTLYLVVMSIFFPAQSDPPADLSRVPFSMSLDWFYMTGYPLFKVFPLSVNWVIFLGFFAVLTAFPWLIKGRRNPPAKVIEDKCEGCKQCFMDCPYEAIYMVKKDSKEKAVVVEDRCAGCGICIGSCTYSANEIPTVNLEHILNELKKKKPDVAVFKCPFSGEVSPREGVLIFTLPCVGAVNFSWSKEILSHTKGLMLISCDWVDCYFREGTEWTEERVTRRRRPRLPKGVEGGRIRVVEAPNVKSVDEELEKFIEELKEEKIPEEPVILYRNRINFLLFPIVLFLPFLSFYPLTTDKMDFYPTDKALIVVSFKYRSTPVKKAERKMGELQHMKGVTEIAVERSPVELSVVLNGKEVLRKTYNPRGLRRDASIYVYEELIVEPGEYKITLLLREVKFPQKIHEITINRTLPAGKSVVITFHEGKGFFPLDR